MLCDFCRRKTAGPLKEPARLNCRQRIFKIHPICPYAEVLDNTMGAGVTWNASAHSVDILSVAGCRTGDPLAGVYDPERLKVMAPCMTVNGTLGQSIRGDDDELEVDFVPDSAYANLIDADSEYNGVPLKKLVVRDDLDDQPMALPSPGSHVAVTGPFVRDAPHAWNEIHPAWSITDE